MCLKFAIGKSHEEALICLSNYFTFLDKHMFKIKLSYKVLTFLNIVLEKVKITVIKLC